MQQISGSILKIKKLEICEFTSSSGSKVISKTLYFNLNSTVLICGSFWLHQESLITLHIVLRTSNL